MHISLVLYAEHEFNASTFTSRVIAGTGSDMYSAIIGAIGALRGPKHGGARMMSLGSATLRNAGRSRSRYPQARGKQRKWSLVLVIRFTIADPRHQVIKRVAKTALAGRRLAQDATSPIAPER